MTDRLTPEQVIRAALSWIEDTPEGERLRKRAVLVLEAIIEQRDEAIVALVAQRQALEQARGLLDVALALATESEDKIAEAVSSIDRQGAGTVSDRRKRAEEALEWTHQHPSLLASALTTAARDVVAAEDELDRLRQALDRIARAGEGIPDWRAMADSAGAALASPGH